MIALALLLAAHPVEPATPVEAERAFASDAQTLGQWTAFAKWSAPGGKLVGGQVVDAIAFAGAQEDPETALRWWPVTSWQSCDGKLAFNVGGWEGPDGQKGRFHTIWTKTEAGWRYVIDMGATGEAHFLPPADKVEEQRAACDRRAPRPLPLIRHRDWNAEQGSSGDHSLRYQFFIGPEGRRRFSVEAWDGKRPSTVYAYHWRAE